MHYPSEISMAEEMGADTVKVFPGKVSGPYFIKTMLGPCPRSKLMPSGGLDITREDASRRIKAGAAVLNIGTKSIPKELVEAEHFKGTYFMDKRGTTKMKSQSVEQSGVIKYIPERCTGCGACELACALYHESACNPGLSRIHLIKDSFTGNHTVELCVQCFSPGCYYICPVKAVEIDPETGARYVNEEKCTGCGKCVEACPLMPEKQIIRFKQVGNKRLFFKCDICKDRVEGPICVECCPASALAYLKVGERR